MTRPLLHSDTRIEGWEQSQITDGTVGTRIQVAGATESLGDAGPAVVPHPDA